MSNLTVGISFFNAESFLDFAILSVLNQTYRDWTLILIDDGSTDNSVNIAEKYLSDNRITLISDGCNKGLAYRLNELASLCNTKYLARMDADDIMHPERLEKQILFMEENCQIDVVGTFAYSINTKNIVSGVLVVNEAPTLISDVFNHKCFIHPTITAKCAWFKENPYDSCYTRMEDEELWLRTINKSHFANIPESLLFYREVGIPYLRKYLLSTKGERALIRKTYNNIFSIERFSLLIKSVLKSFAYIVFSFCNLQDYLISKRSMNSKEDVLNDANKHLSQSIAKREKANV